MKFFKLIFSCIIAGLLIKVPQWFDQITNSDLYYMRNVFISIFFGLSVYNFITQPKVNLKLILVSLLIFTISAIYINLLPQNEYSDSIKLAYLHMPLLLWCLYGLVFVDFKVKDSSKRIEYLKYNGDLAIFTALILIAGAGVSILTIGLFSTIDINIEDIYMENFGIVGIILSPIIATYIIRNYRSLNNRIAPIIAKIFTPFVLIILVTFLITMIPTGKDPYNDRSFLLIFNVMLFVVMAIIVFSIIGTPVKKTQNFNKSIIFFLSIITLVIDIVALSAIIYRIGEFGFTPNRTAILISNFLILVNLMLITIDLYKVIFKKQDLSITELTISKYLPIYGVWAILVTFLFPFLFGMR